MKGVCAIEPQTRTSMTGPLCPGLTLCFCPHLVNLVELLSPAFVCDARSGLSGPDECVLWSTLVSLLATFVCSMPRDTMLRDTMLRDTIVVPQRAITGKQADGARRRGPEGFGAGSCQLSFTIAYQVI
jgi:hypothetical protein